MGGRDPHEDHRVASPLELLFDLTFAIAFNIAGQQLAHLLAEGHLWAGLLGFGFAVFAVTWAWVNFTWFASAYDSDDVPYRLKVLVQIAGVLVLAAGVPRAFEHGDFTVMTLGYAIMRVALVAQWLRAAASHPAGRRTALRMALGVTLCEVGWIGLLLVPAAWRGWAWLVLVPCELLVPVWGERAGATPWHPHHISERYGLLTLILLGESVLAATTTIQGALDAGRLSVRFIGNSVGTLLVFFSMWWIYFDRPMHGLLRSNREGFLWGYGHFVLFAAMAAVGAGLGVFADHLGGHGATAAWQASAALGVPVALFVFGVWFLVLRPLHRSALLALVFPLGSALVVGLSLLGSAWTVLLIGGVLAALVAVLIAVCAGRREAAPQH